MNNLYTKTLLVLSILITVETVSANAVSHSPRLNGAFEYELGGAMNSSPTTINTVPILQLGIGWDLNMECGEFDPQISVSNQLSGITDGFSNMMNNIISAATGAVASLPALAIQRANPGLYDLLQQGILQGKMDFEWAETSCEQMQRIMMGEESFPFEDYKLAIQTNNWATEINASGGDAIQAKQEVDDINHGDDGAEWVCGIRAGGSGQPTIKALADVVKVGYNILFDRNNICTTSSVGSGTGQGSSMWEYWSGPVAASNWATRVIGESSMRTCDGCKKITSTPGKGLTYMHRDMRDQLINDITDIVNGNTAMSWQNLNRVSAPPGAEINAAIIHAVRKRTAISQTKMIEKLGNDIAYARLVEQGRLLTQILRTGAKEPNVSAFDPAGNIINGAIDHLQLELDQLERDVQTRKYVAKNTIQKILGSEEKRVQETSTFNRTKPTGTTTLGHQ